VIDGTDGSGKATQTKLLVERLRQEGYPVETISFPQYGKKSAGLVEEYLSGSYGTPQEVGPYRASIFYAADRYDASFQIRTRLSQGTHVIADRYVGSNMGHQGGKIADPSERKTFFDWELEMEHGLFGIPRPTLNLVLFVPPEISMQLARERTVVEGYKHTGAKDIHEEDEAHIRAASEAYLDLTHLYDNFLLVPCTQDGRMKTREEIHENIWSIIKPYLI
jgi:dTMP kinase